MALSAKVGSFDCPGSTGNAAVTGVGFQPQALIFWYTLQTADGGGADIQFGIGCATATTERWALGAHSTDGVGTSATRRARSSTRCVHLLTDDALTTGLAADLVSFDADGFTLNWAIVTSGADVHYLALAGLSDAKAHVYAMSTSTGSVATTGVGFEPEGALWLTSPSDAANDVTQALSASDGTTTASLGWSLDDGAGNAVGFVTHQTAELLHMPTNLGATDGRSDLTSFDADGFTVNVSDAYSATFSAVALCLAGLSVKVGSFTAPAGTGTQAITGVGFTPKALIVFGSHAAFSSLTVQDLFALSFGAASGATARAAIATAHVDASDPITADHYSDSTKILTVITAGTPTVDLAADLDSFDADGFTLDWTTVGTGASTDQFVYLALGDAPGAGGAVRRPAPVLIW